MKTRFAVLLKTPFLKKTYLFKERGGEMLN
jgi:hypothetical protein